MPSNRERATAIVRQCRREPAAVLREMLRLHRAGEVYVAYELARAVPAAVGGADRRQVLALARGLDAWSSTDCYGWFVGGVAWRGGVLSDKDIAAMAASPDRWVRRAALVCTVPLNCRARGAGEPDARRTLAVCRLLLDDRDDMVVKALSWALRELGRREAGPVRRFLAQHGERVAARVWREVGNKLSTGLKNPRGRKTAALSRSGAA
ncbi:MAG: DNA alkylation repair protein [Phycisphaerales bacterium]